MNTNQQWLRASWVRSFLSLMETESALTDPMKFSCSTFLFSFLNQIGLVYDHVEHVRVLLGVWLYCISASWCSLCCLVCFGASVQKLCLCDVYVQCVCVNVNVQCVYVYVNVLTTILMTLTMLVTLSCIFLAMNWSLMIVYKYFSLEFHDSVVKTS